MTWLNSLSGRKSLSGKLWHALNESAHEQPKTGNGDGCEEARRTPQPKLKAKGSLNIDGCARRGANIPRGMLLLLPAKRWSLARQSRQLNRLGFRYSVGRVLLS